MDNVRVTANPISEKIMIGSTYGSMAPAMKVALDFLNSSKHRERDIQFYCDYGKTVVDFPSGIRKETFTSDELWDIIQKARSQQATVPKTQPSP